MLPTVFPTWYHSNKKHLGKCVLKVMHSRKSLPKPSKWPNKSDTAMRKQTLTALFHSISLVWLAADYCLLLWLESQQITAPLAKATRDQQVQQSR